EEKEEYTLTLEYYPLFPYLDELKEIKESGEVVFRQDRGIGGDLRATLKDKDGKSKSKELVYFYVEKDTPLHRVLGNRITHYQYWEEICNHIDNVDIHSYIGTARTNSEGIASLNYISEKSILPNVLMEKLVNHDGKVNGTVKAVVVKFLGKTECKIECEASVPVEFNSMAKIMKIEGNGVQDNLRKGQTIGMIAGPEQVRVERELFHPTLSLKTAQKEGFELMPHDIISIDGDTSIEIIWINGDKVIAMVPKTDKEGRAIHCRNLTLASTAYNSGFYTDPEKILDAVYGITIEKGVDMIVDTVETLYSFVSFPRKGYAIIIKIIEKMGEDDNGIVKARINSKVVIDSAGDEILFYNIEGSPDIKTVKGEEVTLADKEMVAIAENGSLSEVQSFDPEEVLNEFFDTLNGSITIKAETASTVERETVKLTVMGVAGDPIRVESSPLSD
ncbi:MAG: hypothetical protein IMF19_11660, partial [Proteobacteria bacterium]|nr:hypothetical protein [Pseudomonadota bacterium]